MTRSSDVKRSKFLSLVLRHNPRKAGLTLDDNGWADVSAVLQGAARNGLSLSADDLARVVAENDKQRFALSADGTRIRANQGHSVTIDLDLSPSDPPETLFHGTADRFLASILEHGLRPGRRQHVHLSGDTDTAYRVGKRHGTPVILTVAAGQAARDGQTFWLSNNGVWLTTPLAPGYLTPPD